MPLINEVKILKNIRVAVESKAEKFVVKFNQSISQAFKKIDENQVRSVIVVDDENHVIGIATDGDIRRFLINNPDMNASIELCANKEFKFARAKDSREKILKLLDYTIQVIPIIDSKNRLIDIISRHEFPLKEEKSQVARSKSPVRISFGGGGTDLTHYFVKHGGAVLNATVQIYSHASLRKRSDLEVHIYSGDIKKSIVSDTVGQLPESGPFKLINAAIRLIDPQYGFDLNVYSDFPMKSGLGGSAVVLSSIIGCFNEFREDKWDSYEMAELAFQAERITLDMAGGWQDQYATVFGGFNFMEFTNENNIIHPLRIPNRTRLELEENLLLCYTNSSHNSGDIHKEQKKSFEGNSDIQKLVHQNFDLTYKMKNLILKNRLDEFGKTLGDVWDLKRQFSNSISNTELDDIYNSAMESGALGGKLLGAGGGGFFLFYVRPFERSKVIESLTGKNCTIANILFDDKGLQTWKVRIN